jgi:hypothetical protein
LAHICLGRLLAIGDSLIDRAPHYAGLGGFGVADLAGVMHSIGIEP